MPDADLSFDEVVPSRAGTFFGVRVEYPLLGLDCGGVGAQRVHVCISVIGVGVVRVEATLVAADVGVTACTVHMILHGLARTALSTTSRNVRRTDLRLLKAEFAGALGRSWLVHHRETPAVLTNVSVSTSAIGVVDFGAPSACKYTHF